MPRFTVTVVAVLDQPVDAARLRTLTGGTVDVLSPSTVRVRLRCRGPDAVCAADRAFLDLTRALEPGVRFARPPVWVARRTGVRRLVGAVAGRWPPGNGDDDGLSGVREPRRPIPPTGSAAASVDPLAG